MTNDEIKAFWDVSHFLDSVPKNDERIVPALQTYEALKKKMGKDAYEALTSENDISSISVTEALTNVCMAIKDLAAYENKQPNLDQKKHNERWAIIVNSLDVITNAALK